MLTQLPWRLRWSIHLRARTSCAYITARFGVRTAGSVPAFFVNVDGKPFGRHLSPAIWTSKGAIDGRATGPLFGRLPPGKHQLSLYDSTGETWARSFALDPQEVLVVFVHAKRAELYAKDDLVVECVVSNRAGNIMRHID